MKKILLILVYLVSFASFGQAVFDEGIQITGGQTTTSTTSKILSQESDGIVNIIDAANLPVSTDAVNALDLKTTLSAGAFSGFAVTNNGDGTISVGSGIAYLRATNDQYAPLIKYPIAAYNNIPLVDNLNNYIVVSYNGGSPALVLNTTGTGIDTQTTSIAIAAARVGTTVHYVSLVGSNSDPNAKLRNRYLLSEGIRRVSGLAISATGRKIATTAGITFSGLIRLDVAAMNTNVSDTYTLAYNNGSAWTRVTGQTDINNTQYNNAGTLTTLSNNNFRTDYIYSLVNSPSKLYVILGNAQYNSISAARLAPTPSSLPVELQQLGVLVGRAIIEKDAVTMEVSSPFTTDFAAGAIENHNDLSGLQGGTAGEYNHLTDAQVGLVNGSEQVANKATNFSVVNNTLYPTVQAAKNYADGLVVGLLNDRGSYDASTNLYPSTGGSGTAGAILKGNLWSVSVAGTLGGVVVGVGDWIRALVDSPGQASSNWGVVEGNFGYVPANDANVVHLAGSETISGTKTSTGGFIMNSGLTASSVGAVISSGGGDNLFVNSRNASFGAYLSTTGLSGSNKTFTFPNSSGIFALTSDLHNPVTIGTANGLSLSTQVLSLGLSSASTTGALSSTDWNTFNNKAPSTGGTGYIQNQNSSAQSADMWISGTVSLGNDIQYKPNGVLRALVNSDLSSGDLNTYQYDNTGGFLRTALSISNSTGAATFASSITAEGIVEANGMYRLKYAGSSIGLLSNSLNIDGGSGTDLNAYVYGSNPFNIWTNGAKRMTIDGVGNTTFTSTVAASNGTLIGGTLTSGFIPKATGVNSLGDSTFSDNGSTANISYLSGTGTRVVTADASGNLSTSSGYATLASPAFTGTPIAPTATAGTNTTQIATTAFVTNALDGTTGYILKKAGTGLTENSSISESGGFVTVNSDAQFQGSVEFNDIVSFDNLALLKSYTVATLPTGAITGAIAYVTDATAPTYLGTLTGGGSVVCPVFYNGTAWVSH